MTAKSTWKRVEREVAALFGTRRVPLSGANSGHGTHSDTLSPDMYVEVKYREKFAIFGWFEDVVRKATKENKTPILALKRKSHKGVIFVVRYEDIVGIADKIKEINEGS